MRPLPVTTATQKPEKPGIREFRHSRTREFLTRLWTENRFEESITRYHHHFINDCFSTGLNDVMATLDTLPGPIIWINYAPRLAMDYNALIPLIKSKVRAVFAFGMETGFVFSAVRDHVEFYAKTESLTEALIRANLYAGQDEYVLFAPGAEYDGRGDIDWVWEFKEAMQKLTPKKY